jgi:hypothetical protein
MQEAIGMPQYILKMEFQEMEEHILRVLKMKKSIEK